MTVMSRRSEIQPKLFLSDRAMLMAQNLKITLGLQISQDAVDNDDAVRVSISARVVDRRIRPRLLCSQYVDQPGSGRGRQGGVISPEAAPARMGSFDRPVGEIGASPLLLFELHAPVLVLCRAQSALGGLHTRDESMMAGKTISLPAPEIQVCHGIPSFVPPSDVSTRGKPQMPSIDGCCFCLLIAGSSEVL